jgi:pyrimidine-nucleoside phosphorylase
MSKKLAAGADAIVLDVKCGQGAFMETIDEARALARLMVNIGVHAGRQVVALITQMEQPLGRAVGNTLEVQEAIATLQGQGPADFQELVVTVVEEMLLLGKQAQSAAAARTLIDQAVRSGAALAKFRAFVAAQGGDVRQIDDPRRLPGAPVILAAPAPQAGYVQSVIASEIGLACVDLGGGRHKKGDAIDHRVGVIVQAKVGDQVQAGEPLCLIHAANQTSAEAARERVLNAYRFSEQPVSPLLVLYERVA